jgi:hypothetical protein
MKQNRFFSSQPFLSLIVFTPWELYHTRAELLWHSPHPLSVGGYIAAAEHPRASPHFPYGDSQSGPKNPNGISAIQI